MTIRFVLRGTTLKAVLAVVTLVGLGLFASASATVAGAASTGAAAGKQLVARPSAVSVPTAASIPKRGEFDCNGDSTVEKPARSALCTDIRGLLGVDNANAWGGRFYDNDHYIGHDEPDMTFLSSRPGSGNNVTWNETLPVDPSAAPTAGTPGKNVADWFELSPAPWFSMAMCDPYSYPQLPCVAESDTNAPSCPNAFNCPNNAYPGGGSAVMEMQLYPPGNPPFPDNESCSDAGWCAAITIDSLECTDLYATCQPACEEPINSAFIQTNGVPTGPAGPGDSDFDTAVPNSDTLIMKPGDKIRVHMFDAPAPPVKGGGAGGQGCLQGRHRRLDARYFGFHAGVSGERVRVHRHELRRRPCQLAARVQHCLSRQHHPLGGPADRYQHRVRDRPLRGLQQRDGSLRQRRQPVRSLRPRRNLQHLCRGRRGHNRCRGRRRDDRRSLLRRQRHSCRLGPGQR